VTDKQVIIITCWQAVDYALDALHTSTLEGPAAEHLAAQSTYGLFNHHMQCTRTLLNWLHHSCQQASRLLQQASTVVAHTAAGTHSMG
jgi:hypothetical protein